VSGGGEDHADVDASCRLAVVAARLVLGLSGPEDLPGVAEEALNDGVDTPALGRLAGTSTAEHDEARALFRRVLSELQLETPTPRDAVFLLARATAQQIVDKDLAPYTGARRIWDLTRHLQTERISELDPFIYAASEWEERPEDRIFFEQAISQEAQALLERHRHQT
jgi:hypothetical protein